MKIIATILAGIFYSALFASSLLLIPGNVNAEEFFPPCNLEGEDIGHAANLVWEAPGTCEPDSLPVETAGFRIYRDEIMIAEVDGETFEFEDLGNGAYLPHGTYNYSITALYELGDDLVESEHEGPVEVVIAPGILYINGWIFDCISFGPIAGVTITAGDFSTISQSNGTFTIVLYEFDSLEFHLSAPGYCDTTYLVIWDWNFPSFNFCLEPCGIQGNLESAYEPDEMKIFPVPASDFLNVQMDDGIRLIRLINYNGEIVFETQKFGEQSCQMDVKHFPASIYTLQVVTNNGRILNRKVAINR
jgi:hypothetical protein